MNIEFLEEDHLLVKCEGYSISVGLDPKHASVNDLYGRNLTITLSAVEDLNGNPVDVTTGLTESPTDSPSESPTQSPSPTTPPTDSPSEKPTSSPTDRPIEGPFSSPSESPSEPPTKGPSESPSSRPNESPITRPSVAPSLIPTLPMPPSSAPSSAPTSTPIGTIKFGLCKVGKSGHPDCSLQFGPGYINIGKARFNCPNEDEIQRKCEFSPPTPAPSSQGRLLEVDNGEDFDKDQLSRKIDAIEHMLQQEQQARTSALQQGQMQTLVMAINIVLVVGLLLVGAGYVLSFGKGAPAPVVERRQSEKLQRLSISRHEP